MMENPIPAKILIFQRKEGECMEAVGAIVCSQLNCNPCENQNSYEVYNADNVAPGAGKAGADALGKEGNQPILELKEKSGFCCRAFCAGSRTFEMEALENGKRKFAMKRNHPLLNCTWVPGCVACITGQGQCCWLPEKMEVLGETDAEVLGSIEQRYTNGCYNNGITCCNCSTVYEIKNADGVHISDVDVNPWKDLLACRCFSPQFEIFRPAVKGIKQKDRGVKAVIRNKYMGAIRECCMDIENFSIDFNAPKPQQSGGGDAPKVGEEIPPVPQEERPLHIAATVLLAYSHFEKKGGDAAVDI